MSQDRPDPRRSTSGPPGPGAARGRGLDFPLAPPTTSGAPAGPAADTVVVALGVGLLVATVLLASFRARQRPELDWSNFLMGVAATVALLLVATAARWLSRDRLRSDLFVAWPGAFGAASAGLLVAVAIDEAWAAYPAGLLVVCLSVLGYLATPRPAFVVAAVAGVFVAYLKLSDDLFGFTDPGGFGAYSGLEVGAVLFVFVLLVTAAGWFLPSRVYSGVAAGSLAVAGYAATLVGLLTAGALVRALDDGTGATPNPSMYDDDVWWVIVFSVALTMLWLFAAWVTGHVGFRLLVVAISATTVVLGTSALAVEHPTWWELALGLAGGGVLLLGGVGLLSGRGASGPLPDAH